MNALGVLLLVSTLTATSPVQNPTNSPDTNGVVIHKFSWSKERIGWERDPFGGPVESYDEMRVRARNERRIDDAKRGGSSAEVDRLRRDARADAAIIKSQRGNAPPPRYVFLYKASVKNGGEKVIKAIDWDYVFYEAGTGREINRHQFTSEEKIGAGKRGELSALISAPPTRTVSVYKLDRNERESFDERVEIVRIVYDDGSVWARPLNSGARRPYLTPPNPDATVSACFDTPRNNHLKVRRLIFVINEFCIANSIRAHFGAD